MNKGARWLALMLCIIMLAAAVPAMAELNLLSGEGIYPLNTDQTLSWLVIGGPQVNAAFASWQDSPFHTELIAKTGVSIDWRFPPQGTTDTMQTVNLVMASGDYPDIIFCDNAAFANQVSLFMEDGVVRDLTEKMPEWSPAYYDFLNTNEAYLRSKKTDEGKLYGYGFFREDGGWNDTYLGPVVRQDWLDEQGLAAPTTISEFENVIKVFKEKYNAPFGFAFSRFQSTGLSGAFGAYGFSDFQLFVDDNGKVQLAQAQPEWKNYIAKLNEWWEAGLLNQDIFTDTDVIEKTKALQGSVGISLTSMGQMSNWRREAAEAGNGADWVGLQYPHGDDGTLSMVFGGYGIGVGISVITSACTDEKLETAMRLLDYAYTKEGFLYWNYGTEGVSWEYDAEGNPAYLPIVADDPDGLNAAIDKWGGSTWNGSCIQSTLLLYLKNTQASIDANDLWFYPNEDVSAKWKYPPGITPTADEVLEIDEYQGQLNTYVPEMTAKFVTGAESLDNFDKFLSTLESMHLSRVLEIRQAAYDRYLAR
ncbi:sugar ABC transporter substrate-binding protein [Clostridia bacterium]|nr:sugar ABC transporter substrate-binding protein [Clostridia bacterium]